MILVQDTEECEALQMGQDSIWKRGGQIVDRRRSKRTSRHIIISILIICTVFRVRWSRRIGTEFGAKIQICDEEMTSLAVESDLLARSEEFWQVAEGNVEQNGLEVFLFQFLKHEMFLF